MEESLGDKELVLLLSIEEEEKAAPCQGWDEDKVRTQKGG